MRQYRREIKFLTQSFVKFAFAHIYNNKCETLNNNNVSNKKKKNLKGPK